MLHHNALFFLPVGQRVFLLGQHILELSDALLLFEHHASRFLRLLLWLLNFDQVKLNHFLLFNAGFFNQTMVSALVHLGLVEHKRLVRGLWDEWHVVLCLGRNICFNFLHLFNDTEFLLFGEGQLLQENFSLFNHILKLNWGLRVFLGRAGYVLIG